MTGTRSAGKVSTARRRKFSRVYAHFYDIISRAAVGFVGRFVGRQSKNASMISKYRSPTLPHSLNGNNGQAKITTGTTDSHTRTWDNPTDKPPYLKSSLFGFSLNSRARSRRGPI